MALQLTLNHLRCSLEASANLMLQLEMGKTNKFNDRDHAALANGTADATEHLPRYFAKSGHVDSDPKKTKKNGAGKGGW